MKLIKMKKLNNEQLMRYHKELWGWLAANPDKDKKHWPGWDLFDEEAYADCFACESSRDCSECMILWPGPSNHCNYTTSPYFTWNRLGRENIKDFTSGYEPLEPLQPDEPLVLALRSHLAMKVRDLPRRDV